MDVVGVVARIVLGLVLVVAGTTKLAAGRAWVAQAAGLGVGRPVAVVVPWIEVALGALLVVGVAAPWPAAGAGLLLGAFTVLLARRLSAGEHPPCACFGSWSTRPLGPVHLARNAALIALAVVATWG